MGIRPSVKGCNTDLIQQHLGDAYDVVKDVADNLDTIEEVYGALVPTYKVNFGGVHNWTSAGTTSQSTLGWLVTSTSIKSPEITAPTKTSLVWYIKATGIVLFDWVGDVVVTFDDNTSTTYAGVIPQFGLVEEGYSIDLSALSGLDKTIKQVELIFSTDSNTTIEFTNLLVFNGFIPVTQLKEFETSFDGLVDQINQVNLVNTTLVSKVEDLEEVTEDFSSGLTSLEQLVVNGFNTINQKSFILTSEVDAATQKLTGVSVTGVEKQKIVSGPETLSFVDSIGNLKYYWDPAISQYVHKGIVVLPDGKVIESAEDIVATNPIETLTAYLTRETFLVPTSSAGTSPVYAGSDTRLVLVKGNTEITDGVLFSGGTTKNGLSLSINPVTGIFTLSGSTWSTDQEWFDISATYQGTVYTKRFTALKQKAAEGGTSLNTAALSLYQRTARGSSPTNIATPVGYNFVTGDFTGLPANGWTSTLPASSLPVLWVIQKNVSSSNENIEVPANAWSVPRVLSTDGIDGEGGGGSGAGFYAATYASITWLTTGGDNANSRFNTLVGRLPVFGDIFTQTNSTNGVMESRQWNGSSWVTVSQIINGSLIATNTLAGDVLMAGTLITGPIIRGGKVEMVGNPASTHIKISSNDAFGPNNLIEWFGPKIPSVTWNTTTNAPIYAGMTKANAVSYIGSDGTWYTTGSILAGTLRNANQTTQLGGSTQVETGPFTSNGGIITVKLSFSAVKASSGTGACPTNSDPVATVFLDKWNGSAWVEVSNQTFTGGYNCWTESGEYYAQWECSGSYTFTDPEQSTAQRQFRARVNHNVPVLPNGSQKLSIICEE